MSFWAGFARGVGESIERHETRKLFLTRMEEDRKNTLLGLALKDMATREEREKEDTSLFNKGVRLFRDPDIAAALFKSGELEKIVGVAEKRETEGTLDPNWIATISGEVKKRYGEDLEGMGEEVMKIISNPNDLSDEGNQYSALMDAMAGNAEDMEEYFNKYHSNSKTPEQTMPVGNVNYNAAQAQDTTEANSLDKLINNSIIPLFNGLLTVSPGPDGSSTIIMNPSAEPKMGGRAVMYARRLQSTVSDMVTNYHMTPSQAVDKLAEYTQYNMEGKNGGPPDFLKMRDELSSITPETTFDFNVEPQGGTPVETEEDFMESMGNQPSFDDYVDQWDVNRQ